MARNYASHSSWSTLQSPEKGVLRMKGVWVSKAEKDAALAKIANGAQTVSVGKSKFRVGRSVVHVRFCSENARAPEKFKFNINPNTLSADYELWVCGSAQTYYLMPVAFMREIYDNPSTYVDRMHPEIRVVSVDTGAHFVTFATGGVGATLKPYLLGRVE